MNPRTLCHLASRLIRHPAAPYHEGAVRAEVEKLCADYGLDFERDPFGNVLVRLQTAPGQRPFALAAHLDHPGFEILCPLSAKRFLARFLGGVSGQFFRPGVPLRLMPGRVPSRLGRPGSGDRAFEIETRQLPPTLPTFAVWDLEDFAVRKQRIHGRACDDLIGVASILAAMIELRRSRARVNVIGIISRAEEVGFCGALALTTSRTVPRNSLIVSLETSRELPGVKMGQGVILRVGDRTSIFDCEATRFLAEVAAGLKAKQRPFQFQRGLMSGGTCEATAYQEFGFQTAAVCVALGNYHNCAPRNRIAAEYVSVADACGMVDLLVAAAREMRNFRQIVARLPQRLAQMRQESLDKLRKTASA